MNSTNLDNHKQVPESFRKLAIATLVATLLLIGVGSLVRVSGAGLGCPDWPKCWGCWLPPTDTSKIDPEKYDIEQFNLTKMWIEYANRIVGVTIGLLVLATFVRSFRFIKTRPGLFWGSFAAFILVVFNGWLGGEVVKSGLKPGIITLHMALAIIQVTVLMWVVHISQNAPVVTPGSQTLRKLAIPLFLITTVQLLMGTKVRETIDPHIKEGEVAREEWIKAMHSSRVGGYIDHTHRMMSWLVIGFSAVLVLKSRNLHAGSPPRLLTRIILALVVAEILIGITLAYVGMPPASQVIHLVIAAALICVEFLLILNCTESSNTAPEAD